MAQVSGFAARKLPAISALAWVGLATALTAQEVDCAKAVVQVEMTFCAEQDWMAADDGLNRAYRRVQAAMKAIDADLPKEQRGAEGALRAAQRAWITFRDQACAAEGYAMHGGSAEPMLVYSCRARLTRQRSQDLVTMAHAY